MNDGSLSGEPPALAAILKDTRSLGFAMASERRTGALLAVLAAAKPGGRLLELGTGTGVGTAWLLSGMDATSRLATVDADASVVAVARRHLATDPRVTFHVGDVAEFICGSPPGELDLIYADARAWKVHASGRDAVAAASGGPLRGRRPLASTQLAGGARSDGARVDRCDRASLWIRERDAVMGVGPDARRSSGRRADMPAAATPRVRAATEADTRDPPGVYRPCVEYTAVSLELEAPSVEEFDALRTRSRRMTGTASSFVD